MSWLRIEKHIAVQENNKLAHLEAVDIYTAMTEGSFTFDGVTEINLEEAFPDLYFSSISKEAVIELSAREEQLGLTVKTGNTPLDFVNGYLLDQIIIDDSWHYIENADEIRTILDKMHVKGNGTISLATYISLVKESLHNDIIINHVDPDSLQKDIDYEKPQGLTAKLYPYQQTGFAWMDYVLNGSHGCILGDEMGLGKTLQAIALIQERKNKGEKCLVIAPVSLLQNWYSECHKFAPDLRVLIHHGPKRTALPNGFDNYDLVVTSYGHAVADNVLFCMRNWDLIVLDEAQNIKNPRSNRTRRVKDIPALQRLAVTGTPFENHITDIWSLADFVLPGYLGSEEAFNTFVSDDVVGAKKIEPVLSSIMVRRLVKDVAQDLPEKVVVSQPLSMSDYESEIYEEIRQSLLGTGTTSLPLLQKLRIFCTHPEIYDDTIVDDPMKISIKYQRCCEILAEIFTKREKVILFTSYKKMFDLLGKDIPRRFGVPIDFINGSTPVAERQKKVDWFNNLDGSAILVLNPRAAGTGLNITAANHVIHYNLEWNPALEDQASARAYRRGQKKVTFIYRLFYLETVEEIINDRIERKRRMADTAVVGNDGSKADMQDIIDALNISPKGDIRL